LHSEASNYDLVSSTITHLDNTHHLKIHAKSLKKMLCH
jgi:hypothetical protein